MNETQVRVGEKWVRKEKEVLVISCIESITEDKKQYVLLREGNKKPFVMGFRKFLKKYKKKEPDIIDILRELFAGNINN